jgi:hypothetical protein
VIAAPAFPELASDNLTMWLRFKASLRKIASDMQAQTPAKSSSLSLKRGYQDGKYLARMFHAGTPYAQEGAKHRFG